MFQVFTKKILLSFFMIATGSLVSATLFITCFVPDATFGVEILWQILAFPLLITPISFIFYSKKELSKKALFLRKLLHYIVINIVLIYCAYAFDWLEVGNLVHFMSFILLVLANYSFVCFICFANDQKEAVRLNKKIQEYQKRIK